MKEYLQLFAGAPLSYIQGVGIIALIYGLPLSILLLIIGLITKKRQIVKLSKIAAVLTILLFLGGMATAR